MVSEELKAKFRGAIKAPINKQLLEREWYDRTREIERLKRSRDNQENRNKNLAARNKSLTEALNSRGRAPAAKAQSKKPPAPPQKVSRSLVPREFAENDPTTRSYANAVHRASGATLPVVPTRKHKGTVQSSHPVESKLHYSVTLAAGQSGLFIFTPEGATPLYFLSSTNASLTYVDPAFTTLYPTDWWGRCDPTPRAGVVTSHPISYPILPQSLVGGSTTSAGLCLTSGRGEIEIAVPYEGSCVCAMVGADDAPNFFGPRTSDVSDLLTFNNNDPIEKLPSSTRTYHSAVGAANQETLMNIAPDTIEAAVAMHVIRGATPEAGMCFATTFQTLNNCLAPTVPVNYITAFTQPSPVFYPSANVSNLFLEAQGFFYVRNTSATVSMTIMCRMDCVYSTEVHPSFTMLLTKALETASEGNPQPSDEPEHTGSHSASGLNINDAVVGSVVNSMANSIRDSDIAKSVVTQIRLKSRSSPASTSALSKVKSAHSFLSDVVSYGTKAVGIAKDVYSVGKPIFDAIGSLF